MGRGLLEQHRAVGGSERQKTVVDKEAVSDPDMASPQGNDHPEARAAQAPQPPLPWTDLDQVKPDIAYLS